VSQPAKPFRALPIGAWFTFAAFPNWYCRKTGPRSYLGASGRHFRRTRPNAVCVPCEPEAKPKQPAPITLYRLAATLAESVQLPKRKRLN
jgi:hypothetical protein